MSEMIPRTEADEQLLHCLSGQVDKLREGIESGRPYVWELRLSLADFKALDAAMKASIASHKGTHLHLLCGEYAVTVVMYLAEWYKRFYKGADTADDGKVLSLDTEELKTLYKQAKIDAGTFVYNASKNPDRTSFRWLESLQVLGGLAVQAELRRDEQDDPLLPQLCRLFHGEEIDLDDLKDRERAVAFQESISHGHSLCEYLSCILDKSKEPPFAKSDLKDESTLIPKLLRCIASADRRARRDKFDFEWLIYYNASRGQMIRHLKVKPKPEVIGGGLRQYIGYDRLREIWGVEHPENIGRIRFFLRFKYDGKCIGEDKEVLFKYDNTASEKTGFLSINKKDESICTSVPVCSFDKVELVMGYDNVTKVVQTLDIEEYMQVFALPGEGTTFSDRRNSQAMTVVVFSPAYHLAEAYREFPVVYARFVKGGEESGDYCWCPIDDKVVLEDGNGKEVTPPFFNRNGLYQVITRKYSETIKYRDNAFVRHIYEDPDEEGEQEEDIPVLFGRNGLEVRHFPSRQSQNSELVQPAEYTLEWLKGNRYVDWEIEEPQHGVNWLRVTVQGLIFRSQVYYVPFAPSSPEQLPVWRNFENHRICTALEGVEDIQDSFHQSPNADERENATRELIIGDEKERICLDIYRPFLLRELTQKTVNAEHGGMVEYHALDDEVEIPLISCGQFSVRVFSEKGVKEYHLQSNDVLFYSFTLFNKTNRAASAYLENHPAKDLMPDVPLSFLKIYTSKAMDNSSGLYGWNYKNEPCAIDNPSDFQGYGIVFQSLKDNEFPRHYSMPIIRKPWGGWRELPTALDSFETVREHKTYYFLFDPLIKVIGEGTQIQDIMLPLILKRGYMLTDTDKADLYHFAAQFHFDWMLLPRQSWCKAIDKAERGKLEAAVIDFFVSTPKCTDAEERTSLTAFLEKYWVFNYYQNVKEPLAKMALDLICDTPAVQQTRNDMGDFLKEYDLCRHKFLEMSKAVCSQNSAIDVKG